MPSRLVMFEELLKELRDFPSKRRAAFKQARNSVVLPFYEAYFSNFIEGTEFEVAEAREIIFEGKISESRPADSHDVRGTFEVVANLIEMKKQPNTFEDLLMLLRTRHAKVMHGRPECKPGEFKTVTNKAGSTIFVAPDLVLGTLLQGFGFYRSLQAPLARAIFMLFLISEVHPSV